MGKRDMKNIIEKLGLEYSPVDAHITVPSEKKRLFATHFYSILSEAIKNVLASHFTMPEIIIEKPHTEGVDFTIAIKNIYDLNRTTPIIDCAKRVCELLSEAGYNVRQQGIFVNLSLSTENLLTILSQAHESGYGATDLYHGKPIIVEYSSPNMGKQMTMGHLRTTIIGEVIARIVEHQGGKVIRRNFIGDWGTNFGKLLASIEYYFSDELLLQLREDPNTTLANLYVDAKEVPGIEEKAREYFAKLEQGDQDLLTVYSYIKKLTLDDFGKIYDLLGISFDVIAGEYHAQSLVEETITLLEKDNYVFTDQGASVLKYTKEGYPLKITDEVPENHTVLLLKKSDGSTIYGSRDLASARFRKNFADNCIYVVGKEQSLHFKQWFATAVDAGRYQPDTLTHISYGLILLEGEKMSSRKGNVFRLRDIIDDVASQRPDREDSKKLAITSIVFNDIKNDYVKDIDFDVSKMTSTTGDTGVYINYTYARLKSIIKKISAESVCGTYEGIEREMIVHLAYKPIVLHDAAIQRKPHMIAQYLLTLCQRANTWYNTTRVVDLSVSEQQSKKYLLEAITMNIFSLSEILALQLVETL